MYFFDPQGMFVGTFTYSLQIDGDFSKIVQWERIHQRPYADFQISSYGVNKTGIQQVLVHSFNNFLLILVTSDISKQVKLKLGAKILAPFHILYKHLLYSRIRF